MTQTITAHAPDDQKPSAVCRRFAEYITALRFESIPVAVIEKAKTVFAHDVAVAFGGVDTAQHQQAITLIEARNGTATVIGRAFKAAPEDAAFVNTVSMRTLRMEDTIVPSFVHPGASLMPTMLALGERYHSSGKDALAALVAGYDVLDRISGSVWTWKHGGRTAHHVFGAFGVAAVATKLMRLDVDQTAGALAYAANCGAMITYGLQDFQYGVVTHNGIFAARLGQCRAPFPEDAIEGPYGFYQAQLHGARPTDEEIFDALGSRFGIMTAILKPHPCTAINLVPITMTQELLNRECIDRRAIRSITVIRAQGASRVPNIHSRGPFDGYGGGTYSATSSLPFALAALMADGEVRAERFSHPNDPEILASMKVVQIEFHEDDDLLAHEVVVELASGRKVQAKGGVEVLRTPDVGNLFNAYGLPIVGSAKIAHLRELLATIESVADIGEVAACMAR